MLRRRAQVLARRTPALQMQAQQRALWGRASDLLAWVGLGGDARAADKSTPPPAQAAPPTHEPLTSETSDGVRTAATQGTSERVLRPQPPVGDDFQFPTPQTGLSMAKRRAARHIASAFSRSLFQADKASQLLDVWEVVAQCRPFLVEHEDRVGMRLATARDAINPDVSLLQMLPDDVFARLGPRVGTTPVLVGSTASSPPVEVAHGVEAAPSPMNNVTLLSETMVVGELVNAFNSKGEYHHAVAFYEAYDRDRSVWLQEQRLPEDSSTAATTTATATDDATVAKKKKKAGNLARLTDLRWAGQVAYFWSLLETDRSKLVRLLEDNPTGMEDLCNTVPNLRLLLRACFSEKNGVVARLALDTIAQTAPAGVVPLHCYELGIRANLRAKNRGERELQNALHVARQLQQHGGYVLKPMDWGALIKVSLKMGRADWALEVFQQYPQNRILEHEMSFRQVLRAASAEKDSETVLAMVEYWSEMDVVPLGGLLTPAEPDEREEYVEATFVQRPVNTSGPPLAQPPGSTKSGAQVLRSYTALKELRDSADSELLNMVLWDMLRHEYDAPALKQLLSVMHSRRAMGGAVALRLVVKRLLEEDEKQPTVSPHQVITNSLRFWEERHSVLIGQGFLVHLLLNYCMKREWDDECVFLVDYMLEQGAKRAPLNTVVRVMQANELRGRFDVNARIGDKILAKVPEPLCHKLAEPFYELYLMSYLRLERFDDVPELHAKLKLARRFPHNDVLRTIVNDSANR